MDSSTIKHCSMVAFVLGIQRQYILHNDSKGFPAYPSFFPKGESSNRIRLILERFSAGQAKSSNADKTYP